VSNRKPDDLPAFNRESVRLLSEAKTGERRAAADERELRA
jgi:hypothetical protein